MQRIIFLVVVLGWSTVVSMAQQTPPKIGYVYPAGGQQGTTVEALICGRQLYGAREVLLSGTGVRARVIKNCQMYIANADTRLVARNLFIEAKNRIEKEMGLSTEPTPLMPGNADTREVDPEKVQAQYVYFDRLKKNPTLEDLQLLYYEHFAPRPDRMPSQALVMGTLVEIAIAPDAPPGDRELRLIGGAGFSNAVCFQVGTINEINELEPNDTDLIPKAASSNGKKSDDDPMVSMANVQLDFWSSRPRDGSLAVIRQLPVLELPIVINGQIRRGDVDRFKFKAAAREKLVIGVRARHLIPYLADAVPGWFQAAVTLFAPDGKVVAESSSNRTDPDPLILYEVPKSGVYTLEIQDSIFRGRDDFVYRISIGQMPYVSSMFPLGGQVNQPLAVDLHGWNLPERVALLDTQSDSAKVSELAALSGVWLPYPIRYAVDTLPDILEQEPNDDVKSAMKLTLPMIVNGRIDKPGDVDCFRFNGKSGEKVVLDVSARNLGSPFDGVLELLDANGKQLAFNDDRAGSEGPNIGLETHHADPYLMVELPANGEYTVRLYHSGSQGGSEYAYRLRASAPRPDFEVFVSPSGLVLDKAVKPFQAHVIRKDGFDGEIRLRLKSTVPGISLGASTIPTGADKAECELKTDSQYDGLPRSLRFEAVATVNGKEFIRAVTVVDDHEQAFIYHHWVPVDSMSVAKPRRR